LDAVASPGLEVGRAKLVARIARAFFDAGIDRVRLEQTICDQIGGALEASCELVAADVATSPSSLTIPLHAAAGRLQIHRAAPFDDGELELAHLLANHAEMAIAAAMRGTDLAEASQARMRDSLTRFARLDQAGMIGVVVGTLDGRILEINDTAASIVGFARDEILTPGFNWSALTPPEFREVDRFAISELQNARSAPLREKQYIRKDGSRVTVMLGSALLDDTSGSAISFMLDVTERAEREAAALRASEAKAIEQRLRLAAIVDSSADAIIGKTLDGVITSWNAGARDLFGYDAGETIGKSVTMLIPPGHEREEDELLAHLRRGEVTRLETVRLRKDGRNIHVAVTSSPTFDAAGKVAGASKVARDITERHAAELALAAAKEAAEAASRELEAFSYSVAHDLRAPLRGIDAFARFLADDYTDKLDAEGRDHIDEIRSNARRMSELIDALLSLSRVTRSEIRRERTDLGSIARAVEKELAAAQPERRVEVIVTRPLFADVDPRLARALITNLVGNAWKFTGNVANPRIEVGCAGDPEMFFVRDNGAGFDMAFAKNLFAPFQRMHTVHEFPGTGIGLATVQRIVHRHGGRIWAEAVVGAGAAFFFTLPAGKEHA
jgi:PAS domain S-box-containing protein